MRPEQINRLAQIEEKLVDVFTEECKPADWPGMANQKDRGDRYWHKKNALATLQLVGRIQTVLRDLRTGDGGKNGEGKTAPPDPDREESLEEEAARLERQGAVLLKKHRGKAR